MPRIHHRLFLHFALTILIGCGGPLVAQTYVAPCYSLPKDGDWIELEWRATSPDKKDQAGIVRVSSVGKVEVGGKPHRWIEIKKEVKRGESVPFKLRKLLVAEKAFTTGQSLEAHVVRAFGQRGANAPVISLTPSRIHELLSLGVEGAGATLVTVSENEGLETKLGKCTARHVSATGKDGERTLEYHGWLTNEVPFGCAKFTIHERTARGPPRLIFSAVAVRQGHDAMSELDEGKVK